MALTAINYPEVKYVTPVSNTERVLAWLKSGGYLLLEILKFWGFYRIFHQLKISFIHL